MTSKQETERTMVFIDLRNVLESQHDTTGSYADLDLPGIVSRLVGSRNLVGKYVFDGEGTGGSSKHHDNLRACGFRVIVRSSEPGDQNIQKEVDVAMSCEILSHAIKDHYDTAIIVTGDRDFRPAVEKIQSEGKRAEIAGFSISMSRTLSICGDGFHNLDCIPIRKLATEQPRSESSDPRIAQKKVMANA